VNASPLSWPDGSDLVQGAGAALGITPRTVLIISREGGSRVDGSRKGNPGHIELSPKLDTVAGALSQICSGEVPPLAVTSAARSAMREDVPTMTEAGLPDLLNRAEHVLSRVATEQRGPG